MGFLLKLKIAFSVALLLFCNAKAQEIHLSRMATPQEKLAYIILKHLDDVNPVTCVDALMNDTLSFTMKTTPLGYFNQDLSPFIFCRIDNHSDNTVSYIAIDIKRAKSYRISGFRISDLLSLIEDVRDIFLWDSSITREYVVNLLDRAISLNNNFLNAKWEICIKKEYDAITESWEK